MRRAAFAAALVITALVIWPLGPLAAQLFAIHMTQHLLLIAVVAPLAVLSGVQWRMRPVYAWCLFVGVFLFWHIPAAFQQAALYHVTLLELACILAAAVAFWSTTLGDNPLSDGARALMVMMAAVVTDLPGVLMLFAPHAICIMPGENAAAFGLTPLEDQQIAGLLMWVPANLVFFGIATFLFARWIGLKAHPA
jgi:cytochrome c oxidase assembly factor CtaG